ncbi:hypothetical protein [Bacteroides acidifaciens]|uniref:hypothetical protein n=1 Tax=Bacteroides acidifaciens TaxID=85831 RepID=UPI003F6947D7
MKVETQQVGWCYSRNSLSVSEITDKNGNSIFEHDLILIHESESSYQFTVEVLFHKGMFCYKNRHVALLRCGTSAIDVK